MPIAPMKSERPAYVKPFVGFLQTAKPGNKVRLDCYYRDSRKGAWIPYTVTSTVKEMSTNCVIVEGRAYGIPYFAIHNWEIVG